MSDDVATDAGNTVDLAVERFLREPVEALVTIRVMASGGEMFIEGLGDHPDRERLRDVLRGVASASITMMRAHGMRTLRPQRRPRRRSAP